MLRCLRNQRSDARRRAPLCEGDARSELRCLLTDSLGESKLMGMFELQACGYLKIGAALDALEGQERLLGAAFYFLLRRWLYRWIRIYDHTDAEAYNEQLHEWMEQDESRAGTPTSFLKSRRRSRNPSERRRTGHIPSRAGCSKDIFRATFYKGSETADVQ
jgi:hypothetical protein